MKIENRKFDMAMRCLENSIKNTEDEANRLESKIDKNNEECNVSLSHLYIIELSSVKAKLATLQFTYKNFKESIIE